MTEENKPLLSDDMIELFNDAKALDCDNNMSEDAAFHFVNGHLAGMNEISGIYERARTKDRELIQTLTNSIGKFLDMANDGDVVVYHLEDDQPPPTEQLESTLALAGEQGYQPTEK